MQNSLREQVRERAKNCCEYCQLRQMDEPYSTYQIEHIIAKQHGGSYVFDNLALACSHCNLHKGPNLAGIDPLTEQIVPLFHPRIHLWSEHFEWLGTDIFGRTDCGRATVRVLLMNADVRRTLRRILKHG
jgi:hypothetical protein